jgi:hypothetical protein
MFKSSLNSSKRHELAAWALKLGVLDVRPL